MYTKSIPFKDFDGNPRNIKVQFNLSVREVLKLLVEFQAIFKWQESIKGPLQELPTEEVVEFYNNFEKVLLDAYGVMSEDGLYFRKGGRYDFEESALFDACMQLFLTDPTETTKLTEAIMPKELEELVRNADAQLANLENPPENVEELRAEIARLRAGSDQNKEPSSE